MTEELDAQGCATIRACFRGTNAGRSPVSTRRTSCFRSHIVMARHGFGRGEYKYFSYPLPDLDCGFRTDVYPHLVPIANRWNEAMKLMFAIPRSTRTSSSAATRPARPGRRRCCSSTAPTITTACIRISTANMSSRSSSPSCCPEPGEDFTGGEFVMTEQRPRMQSRPMVVPLRQGDGVSSQFTIAPCKGRAACIA